MKNTELKKIFTADKGVGFLKILKERKDFHQELKFIKIIKSSKIRRVTTDKFDKGNIQILKSIYSKNRKNNKKK
jgi:hypothetical protein